MKLHTINAAANILDCSPKTVRRAINAGEIRVVRLGKSARSDRIHPEDLELFISRKRTTRPLCPSSNVVELITSIPMSTDAELEKRLAKGQRKRKQRQ